MRESELLRLVYQANNDLGSDVLVPPGDDLGVICVAGQQLLLGVDQLVGGRHVDVSRVSLELTGRKAVTRCLSDVAAMAARPVATLAAVTLPPGFGAHRAERLFESMRITAGHYGAPLIGGDIAIHRDDGSPLVCSITVLAAPAEYSPVRRNGAKVGDGVYVTGRLGGSVEADGGGRHLTFEPRIKEAGELLSVLGSNLHAMIDVSDGLGRDAGHIAEMSDVSLQLDAAAIPCTQGLDWKRAASDGEDYELLFTTNQAPPTSVNGIPVTRLGVVESYAHGNPRVTIVDGAARIDASELGWDHGAATNG